MDHLAKLDDLTNVISRLWRVAQPWRLELLGIEVGPSSGRHSSTSFRAVAASFGAGLTVLGLVLLTFRTARVADLGAKRTQLARECAARSHELCGQATDRRAVAVESNAVGHHLDVGFAEAG
jgi:hypothetical protein